MGRSSINFSLFIASFNGLAGASVARAQSEIPRREPYALSTSTTTLGAAEAVTAHDALGTDALFYNPSGLAWAEYGIELIGVTALVDRESGGAVLGFQKQSDAGKEPVQGLLERLATGEPTYAGVDFRALGLSIGHVAATMFGGASILQRHTDATDADAARDDVRLAAVTGWAIGAGARLGPVGIGYSAYRLARAELSANVDAARIAEIQKALETPPLGPASLPYDEFLEARLGGTSGHNAGLSIRPFGDNPSGIGVAVLNAGGSRFARDAKLGRSEVDSVLAKIESDAAEYGLTLVEPDPLPEVINAGLHVGVRKEIAHAGAMVDFTDIGGSTVEKKLAVAANAGFSLPDQLALKLAIPLFPQKKQASGNFLHGGFKGFELFGGMRPGDYGAVGTRTTLHFGANRAISPVLLDVETLSLTPTKDASVERQGMVGIGVRLSLALMF